MKTKIEHVIITFPSFSRKEASMTLLFLLSLDSVHNIWKTEGNRDFPMTFLKKAPACGANFWEAILVFRAVTRLSPV